MPRRSSAALIVSLTLAVAWLVAPSPAGAATFTTTLTCSAVGVCGTATTNPAPPAGASVTVAFIGGTSEAQIFRVEPAGTAEITSIVGTFSDGGTETKDPSDRTPLFIGLSPTHYVSTLTVTWTDTPASTTSSSTSSTSSTSSSSTSSTSSTTTSSTTTSTTSTTTPTRGPGHGPIAIRPDKVAKSSPDVAAVRGSERLDVVVAGDGAVHWTAENYPSPWIGYVNLGAPAAGLKGNPAIVSWAPGRLDIFVRGGDDKLYQKVSTNGGQNWSDWIFLFEGDGTLSASPEVSSRGPNRLNLFVVNVDGDLYERFYDGPEVGGGGWSGWTYHGRPDVGVANLGAPGGDRADPATVAWGSSERWDLFVRGTDSRLYQRFYDGSTTTAWFRPVDDNALIASEPEAASWEPGNLLVFARWADNRVYVRAFGTGGWGPWIPLVKSTDQWLSGPGATSRGTVPNADGTSSGRFDLFVRGVDDLTYHIWQ